MHLKIGIIINTNTVIADYQRQALTQDCELLFCVSALHAAIDVALRWQNTENVDAIITMMATARLLREYLTIPVVPMDLKSYDVLCALWHAKDMGKNPGFVEIETQNILYDFDEITHLLGIGVKRYGFRGLEHVRELAEQIKQDGCDIVATMGTKSAETLRECGVRTFLFAPSVDSFLNAIQEVRRIFEDKGREIEKNRWLNAIVNEIDHGILAWDRNGNIILANGQAQRALGVPPTGLIGHQVEKLRLELPLLEAALGSEESYNVVQNAGMEYLVRRQDLTVNRVLLGGILRIEDVKNIQSMELQARRSRSETRFVATAHFSSIQGHSKVIEREKQTAKKYAQSEASVLIYGESGSGKELFAQSIHNYSRRWEGPFVAVNCSAFTDSLLESELFGYEEGAFTGAKKKGNPGLFELAHGGTLFMDEIGEMPLYMQSKILRVLQEKTVRRIGGNKNIPLDVRFIFATNRMLTQEVKKGTFRSDLYYRINVLPLYVPPLRYRKEDIQTIAESIYREISGTVMGGSYIPSEYMYILAEYDWPGNVRELRNFVERLAVLGIRDEQGIRRNLSKLQEQAKELSEQYGEYTAEGADYLSVPIGSMKEMEKEIIARMLKNLGGDRRKLEETLKLSRTTVWRYLKELGLEE